MRAFFANGVDEMGIPWAVEGLPTLLHLSLFLFFAGLVIFLFNVDQEVCYGPCSGHPRILVRVDYSSPFIVLSTLV
jgi:Family of unknown function (DUF6535)